jgi:large subunit ribosomal protein L15
MRLHDLKAAPGARRERKRLGRGNASGQGTTAGKGTKGEKARAGGLKAGFRGMSSRNFRLAKRRGFTNRFKTEYQPVNLAKLADAPNGATIDLAWLKEHGLVRGQNPRVKILGDGEVNVALHFVGVQSSGAARQKIASAGGSIEGIEVPEPSIADTAGMIAPAPEATSAVAPAPSENDEATAIASVHPAPTAVEPDAQAVAGEVTPKKPARARRKVASIEAIDAPESAESAETSLGATAQAQGVDSGAEAVLTKSNTEAPSGGDLAKKAKKSPKAAKQDASVEGGDDSGSL